MARVYASVQLPGQASAAETLWYDTTRWSAFVDGFGHLERIDGLWPQAGSSVTWTSAPGGRGRVIEDVSAYETCSGQRVSVEDERMRGMQHISFEPNDDGVLLKLELVYQVKGAQPGPLKSVFDALFVRRPMRDSLTRTLAAFRREFIAETEL